MRTDLADQLWLTKMALYIKNYLGNIYKKSEKYSISVLKYTSANKFHTAL